MPGVVQGFFDKLRHDPDVTVRWLSDRKAGRVLAERQITREFAEAVLAGAVQVRVDAAHSTLEETRWRALGYVDARPYLVVIRGSGSTRSALSPSIGSGRGGMTAERTTLRAIRKRVAAGLVQVPDDLPEIELNADDPIWTAPMTTVEDARAEQQVQAAERAAAGVK